MPFPREAIAPSTSASVNLETSGAVGGGARREPLFSVCSSVLSGVSSGTRAFRRSRAEFCHVIG